MKILPPRQAENRLNVPGRYRTVRSTEAVQASQIDDAVLARGSTVVLQYLEKGRSRA
jgi:hypothetical protein